MTTHLLECKFEKNELLALILESVDSLIIVKPCSMPGDKISHMCATSEAGNFPNIIIGCPFPPGWEPEVAQPESISEADAIRFTFPATPLGRLVVKNMHAPGRINQVSAVLCLETSDDNSAELFVSFLIKDADGKETGEFMNSEQRFRIHPQIANVLSKAV